MSHESVKWSESIAQYRPYLIGFAFRITGSLAEAEDIVQETFIECLNFDPNEIHNHKSWLTKVCSNKALDYLKSARKKRESYVGVWLPDEIPDGLQVWDTLVLSESLTTSFLLMLQKLTPEERVIYLLSEVFDYSFSEISELLNKKVPACKKMAQRARDAIASEKNKFDPPPENAETMLRQFFSSAKSGNVQEIMKLLAPNSELWGDGGGKVTAAGFIQEEESIAEFFKRLVTSEVFRSENYRHELHQVNSRPGIVISRKNASEAWVFDTILSFEFSGDKIACIYAQRNPDKLESLLRLSKSTHLPS